MLTKAALENQKKVKIHGHSFVIRKINPLLDFTPERMPSIFSSFQSRRKTTVSAVAEMSDPRKAIDDMMMVVEAGLIVPELSKDSATGITIKDIFRDSETGAKLYLEILDHSLNQMSGMRKVFFYLLRRLF